VEDHRSGDQNLTFRAYQEAAVRTDQVPDVGDNYSKALMVPLLGLAGEAGSLLSEFKKWLRQGDIYRPFADQVSEEIGDILWYVSNIASKMHLDLDEVARENLAKLQDRWGESREANTLLFSSHYDDQYPDDEKLPEAFRAEFRMIVDDGRKKLAVMLDGEPCGDHLTDNAYASDGYRFHDCFHLALATMLRWSPILRKLLKRKRKSNREVDEVEDGARASITEEAVSVVVYEYAKNYSMFDGADSIEYELLRTIMMMTRPYEVRDRTAKEWELAILHAYKAWRSLNQNDGGIVIADARTQKFEYQPLAE
jgi:NTP pyrophosphatase (non-canonical NTP hydrolase)